MITWENIKDWSAEQSVPRWQMLAGAALVLFFNLGFAFLLHSWGYKANIELSQQQDVRGRMTEVRLIALDFQTFAADYVSSVIEKDDLSEPEKLLIENVMRQHSAVELSKGVYSPETLVLARKYQDALASFNAIVPKSKDVVEMAPFWTAASEVLVSRDAFLVSLERQASPPGS